jgi:hypothetical protein
MGDCPKQLACHRRFASRCLGHSSFRNDRDDRAATTLVHLECLFRPKHDLRTCAPGSRRSCVLVTVPDFSHPAERTCGTALHSGPCRFLILMIGLRWRQSRHRQGTDLRQFMPTDVGCTPLGNQTVRSLLLERLCCVGGQRRFCCGRLFPPHRDRPERQPPRILGSCGHRKLQCPSSTAERDTTTLRHTAHSSFSAREPPSLQATQLRSRFRKTYRRRW